MERREFLTELSNYLAYQISPSELQSLLDFYDESILELMDDGYSERAAVATFPAPRDIAATYVNVNQEEVPTPRPRKGFRWGRFLFLAITSPIWLSLLAALFCVIFSIYLCILCIPLTTAICGFAGTVAGAVATIASPFVLFDIFSLGLVQFGIGLLALGLGLICLWLTYYFIVYFGKFHHYLFVLIKDRYLRRKAVYA